MAQEKIYEVELTREELEIINVALLDTHELPLRLINYCKDKGYEAFADYLNGRVMLAEKFKQILNNI